jgi:ADP-ribose pyrophosphatase
VPGPDTASSRTKSRTKAKPKAAWVKAAAVAANGAGGAGKTSSKASSLTSSRKARVLSSRLAYQGKVFSVYTDKVEEPGGSVNERDVIRHNGSVVILAVDESKNPRDPEVILERQYRHAAGRFLLELPAGRIEPGEAPLAAAKREMIEETGYRAKRWTLLTKYFASPGFLGEWMQIYLAREIRDGLAQPEADEQIEIVRLPLSQAMALVAANKIHDGKTLIGLSLYAAARKAGRL